MLHVYTSTDFILADTPDTLAAVDVLGGVPMLTPERFAIERADAHLLLIEEDVLAARCSLWWRGGPAVPGERPGLVGHYATVDDAAAEAVLSRAADLLRARGCTLAIGPMDGATWRGYRFVTQHAPQERGAEPAFAMEPAHPAAYPQQFAANGFAPLATYRSALVPDLRRLPGDSSGAPPGLRLRPLDPGRLDGELEALYDLMCASFREALLYTPPPKEAFVERYRKLLPQVDPRLVLLAEQGGRLAGCCFLLPDYRQAARGAVVDTVILKTLAVHPDWQGRGFGRWLVAEAHRTARACGFRRAIHALMHEANPSIRISGATARPIRRYTLFAKPLRANEAKPVKRNT